MDTHEEHDADLIEVTTFGPAMDELLFRLQSGFADVLVTHRKSDEQIVIRANYHKVQRLLNEMIEENDCTITRLWRHRNDEERFDQEMSDVEQNHPEYLFAGDFPF